MRIAMLASVSGIALLMSATAFAVETPSTITAPPVSQTDNSQKIICHYLGHEGHLLPKPTCGTQYAWDKQRRWQEQEISDFQLRSLSVPAR